MIVNSFIPVKCFGEISFFKAWMCMMAPYHRLSKREQEAAARILFQYFKIKNSMPKNSDPSVLKEVLWSKNSRKDIMTSLKMSQAHFQMVLAKLRAVEFIKDGEIAGMYIPKLEPGMKRYGLCFGFYGISSPNSPINREEEKSGGEVFQAPGKEA